MMQSVLNKLTEFRANLVRHGLQVNIHPARLSSSGVDRAGKIERAARSTEFAKKVTLYACLVASGAIMVGDRMHRASLDTSVAHHEGAGQTQVVQATLTSPAEKAHPEVAPEQDKPWTQVEKRLGPGLKYVQVNFEGHAAYTIDARSRLELVKAASDQQKLERVGLSWKDLYGVIHAETGWIARSGVGKNGVVSSGLAQLEPATAKSLGIDDPDDPVQAVYAAAALLKDAAVWSNSRVSRLRLGSKERAVAVREGISIYYNLSTRGRSAWDGRNTDDMPSETQTHIANARDGARLAGRIEIRTLQETEEHAGVESEVIKPQVIQTAMPTQHAKTNAPAATHAHTTTYHSDRSNRERFRW